MEGKEEKPEWKHTKPTQALQHLSASSQLAHGFPGFQQPWVARSSSLGYPGPAALGSPVLPVVHTPHMTSSFSRLDTVLVASSAHAPASGTFKIWGSLLQTWVSRSKLHRQSTPRGASSRELDIALQCLAPAGFWNLGLSPHKPATCRACKLGTCGRCCQVLIPGLVLPQLPWPLECLPAESG